MLTESAEFRRFCFGVLFASALAAFGSGSDADDIKGMLVFGAIFVVLGHFIEEAVRSRKSRKEGAPHAD